MLLFVSTFISTAIAGSVPSINLPNVADIEDGIEINVGTGAAILDYGPLPSARVGMEWQSGTVSLRASSTTYFGRESERFDVIGASWALVDRARVRFGPVLTVAQHTGTSAIDHRLTARAGLGLDTGGERIRFDMTISMIGAGWYPRGDVEDALYKLPIFDTLLVTELGVRHSWDSHQVRVGLFGPLPTLGYQWSGERLSVRVDGATMMGAQQVLWLQVGHRI